MVKSLLWFAIISVRFNKPMKELRKLQAIIEKNRSFQYLFVSDFVRFAVKSLRPVCVLPVSAMQNKSRAFTKQLSSSSVLS
jgi:hypothetical protein